MVAVAITGARYASQCSDDKRSTCDDTEVHGYMNDDIVSRCNCDAGNDEEHDALAQTPLGQWIAAGVRGVAAPLAGRADCTSV